MEQFKEKLSKRILILKLLVLVIAVVNIVLLFYRDHLPEMEGFIAGFQGGVFVGLEFVLILNISKYTGARKNEKKLKQLYIEETDERTILILQKTGETGMNTCYIGLALATIIAGFFNEIVFLTLLGATIFIILVKGIFKIYYRYKM